MAPNKRGGGLTSKPDDGSVLSKAEISERGTGTQEATDTYDASRFLASETRTFFTCVMFLTRLPCPAWTDHHPAFLMRSMLYFPLTGLLIGGWGAVWHAAAAPLWGAHAAALVSTAATVWLTGCFHEDGLADTMDGFGGGWGRAQILRIMKDSRVGTYGCVGSVLALLLKTRALTALGERGAAAPALLLGHSLGRWVSLPLLFFSHYIQDEEDAKKGMYNWFAQCQQLLTATRLALATLFTTVVAFALTDVATAAALLLLCAVVAAAAAQYSHAIIGGVVGDFLGASIAVAEILIYLTLLVDWKDVVEPQALRSLAVLAAVATLPILYSRRIVDYNTSC